jgi:hypothetical protein
LKALAQLNIDPVRAAIDAALAAALHLPDLKPLRQLLAREPGLTGIGISPKPGQQTTLFAEEKAKPAKVAQLKLI